MPKINFVVIRKVFFVIFSLLVVFSSGYLLGVKGYKANVSSFRDFKISREVPDDKNVDFNLFWKVWDTLGVRYFDKTKLISSEMVYGAISGMVSSLGDPYTVFLPPKENKIVQEDLTGSFDGVGIQIGYKNGNLVVIAPLPDSPAMKANVKSGDYIVHIKDTNKDIDTSTQGLSLPVAVQMIRGKAGTKVTLTFVREGVSEPFEVEIARAKLDIPSVELKVVGENQDIAHLKINKFAGETDAEWDAKVKELLKNTNIKSIILDLRGNPGGYMQAAVDLASDFIDQNKVVVIEERNDGTRVEYKASKSQRLKSYKLVILVDGGSASASEIMAGALRDQLGTKLMGTKSFGKGTIQEPIEIPVNGSGEAGLHVTIARWLTPNGNWVHEKGLEPDKEVKDNPDTIEDEQLQEVIKTAF